MRLSEAMIEGENDKGFCVSVKMIVCEKVIRPRGYDIVLLSTFYKTKQIKKCQRFQQNANNLLPFREKADNY